MPKKGESTMSLFPLSPIEPVEKTVQDAIDAIKAVLNFVERSITIAVVNETIFTLNLFNTDDGKSNFSSGGYAIGHLPAVTIPPGEGDAFAADSSGLLTGVVGAVHYRIFELQIDTGGIITLSFANPFLGDNHYEQQVTPAPGLVTVFVTGSIGNQSQVIYTVRQFA